MPTVILKIIIIMAKRMLSAVQPSGIPTIGNYVGAIKNFVGFQDDYECVYSIADLHTLTVKQEPSELRAKTYELLAIYLACGLDPEKSVIFAQSHVSCHAELCWILNTITYVGEMQRMTQFKDKSLKHAENINMGLMDYPVLMAADILLYNADYVPIGADQKQHLEIARDLAMRFNSRYSETFTVPEPYIPKVGAKVMSLADPSKKMSKSDENVNAFISMNDTTDDIIRKFKRAVTDSESEIRYDEQNKPGVSNLLTIYSLFSGESIDGAVKRFDGKGYGEFKLAVGEAVAEKLRPITEKKNDLLKNKDYLLSVLKDGRDRAALIAYKTLRKVYKKVGLVQL